MKLTRTLALGIVFLLLAGYVYFFEMRGAWQKDEAGKHSLVLPMAKEEIESFSLSGADQTIRCAKDTDNVWWLTEPVRTEGSERDIGRLLSSLEEAAVVRTVVDSAANLGDYGLDRPRLSIGVRGKTGLDEHTLMLGRNNPTGSYVYARRSGSPAIFLVSTALLHSLGKGSYDLRLKKVLDFKPGDVRKISLRRGNETITCIRSLDSWRLDKPIEARASRDAVERMLQTLSEAVAREFVAERSEGGTRYGFDRPTAVIDLAAGEGDTAKCLVIGQRTGNRYYAHDVSRQPVFTVDSTLVSVLTMEAGHWRDRSVLAIRSQMVFQIGWETEKGSLLCRKDSSGTWEMVRPIQARADGGILNDLLQKLERLTAEAFVSDSPTDLRLYGLASPRSRIEMRMEGDSAVFALSVGGNHGGQIYVQNSTAPSVYLVNASVLDLVEKDPAHFRDRRVLDFFTEGVQEMEIGHSGGMFRATRGSKGQWKTSDGRSLAAGDVANLLSGLHELRAESFVDDRPTDLSLYGLDRPRYTITLRFESKAPEVLRIGKDGEQGTVYMVCGKNESVLVVKSGVMERMDRLVRGEQTGI